MGYRKWGAMFLGLLRREHDEVRTLCAPASILAAAILFM